MRFPINLTPDDNGTFLVTAPDLPEVTTFGEDEADAVLRAEDAIETAIQGRMTDRKEIPEPRAAGAHFVTLPAQTALKVALYSAMLGQGVRKAELARRLQVHAPQVDRLFDLRHASRIDQIDSAFRALGKQVTFHVE
jgi:antitoxin HicB